MAHAEGYARFEDIVEIYIDEYVRMFLSNVRRKKVDVKTETFDVHVLDTKYSAFRMAANTLKMSDEEHTAYLSTLIARTYVQRKKVPNRLR